MEAVTKKIVVETGIQVQVPQGVCFHDGIMAWLFVSVPKAWRELMGAPEKMMEMYKTKATKAWQALERIIHFSRSATSPEETASSFKENENGLAGCDDGSAGGTRFCLGQLDSSEARNTMKC